MNPCNNILSTFVDGSKLLAVLLDPDKLALNNLKKIASKINASCATHIFVGGSRVENKRTHEAIAELKQLSKLPVVIFPGDINQISEKADAILFLSLTSGRNPAYIIGKQVLAAPILRHLDLEVISTSYILVGVNNDSAVQQVTNTQPIDMTDVDTIVNTALAGEYLGHKLVYIEAGSGAHNSVCLDVVQRVKQAISIPLVIGGGINDATGIKAAYAAGADMVVIGSAFENDMNFFENLKTELISYDLNQNEAKSSVVNKV